MKFPKVTTFWMATLPITLVNFAIGLGTLEYPAGRPRRILSYCWAATLLILFCYFLWVSKDDTEFVGKASIDAISYQFYVDSSIASVIVLVCFAQLKSKNIKICLHELDTVNKIFNQNGISKKYESLFKLQIIELTIILIFILLLSAAEYLRASSHEQNIVKLIGQILINIYTLVIVILGSYSFCIYVRYIGERFQHLNSYFVKLTAEEENAEDLFRNSSVDRHIPWLSPEEQFVGNATQRRLIFVIQNTKKIHRDLSKIARKLNEAFGVSVLISLANTFSFLVVFGHHLLKIEKITISGVLFLWITILSIKVVYIASVCAKTSTEAQRMRQLLHRLIEPTTDTIIREEVDIFSMELKFKPLRFTTWGFLELNYMLITKMIGAVATYLIILFQLGDVFGNANNAKNFTISVMNTTA